MEDVLLDVVERFFESVPRVFFLCFFFYLFSNGFFAVRKCEGGSSILLIVVSGYLYLSKHMYCCSKTLQIEVRIR